jgi:large subunit ribosomal protein L31
MKSGTHPNYRAVVFYDPGAQFHLLTRSSIKTSETIEYEGKTYPLVKVDISSATHPFYTGKQTFVDTAGRLDRFNKKFGGKLSFQKTDKK